MASSAFFKSAFDELAVDGYIGDPQGEVAYAYLRVSSDDQADEGRSGLPRQVANIHQVACKEGYKIPWQLVFADDHSGFEFEERPQLTELRNEIRSGENQVYVVVMEHLDRLSRNADWHQGYLLDEMKSQGVLPVFWKTFSSRIERAVVGAVSQEAMEQAKERMMQGNLHKARSGRVTARTAAYGYKLVDSHGNEGPAAKRDTHYAVNEDEAAVVRILYQQFIAGVSMRQIAIDLTQSGIKPPKQAKNWEPSQIRLIIRNEVYRGDFYAHRWKHTTVQKLAKDGVTMRKVKCKVEYPRKDWIHVPVPAIVSREDWEAANRMLEQNKKMARRNARIPFLLTGLVKCAYCGMKFYGVSSQTRGKGKLRKTEYRGYRCPYLVSRSKYLREEIECHNSSILCSTLDDIVWNLVCQALLDPEILLAALDTDATSERNKQLQQQARYLEREISSRTEDDEKLLKAYMAGAFDADEYAAWRKLFKTEVERMTDELSRVCSEILTPEQLEERKKAVLAMSKQIQEQNIPVDPPFELKQRIIKMVVDEIVLDVPTGWLELKGAIHRVVSIENIPVPAAI